MLTLNEYKDKLMGCWMGKNIGGTLGAPFEGKRDVFNIDFYVQDLKGNPPANDDLDLQLLWLNAVERHGRNINASILGEYWLSFIIPEWAEYGMGKHNLGMGLVPPLSGYMNNPYKDSCGCFIRSEIWACLAPGHPEIAVRYAYEDAIVDHSSEGLYAEIFAAAMQSAAFVESDKYKLIDIGLSYIPQDCGIAKGIKTAIDSYKSGISFEAARKKVLTAVPGSFGLPNTPTNEIHEDIPVGNPGWDAPSNIGIMIIGWLYGEDDFGKSLCFSVNCGEDADCTAATLGATLGIIHGAKNIPQKWIEPMGDTINTICINYLQGTISVPKTVTELTNRILRLTPLFLGPEICDILAGTNGYTVSTLEGENLYCRKEDVYVQDIYRCGINPDHKFDDILNRSPFVVNYKFTAFNALLDYMAEPYITACETRKIKLILENSTFGHPQWLELKWHLPEGVKIYPNSEISVSLPHTYNSKVELVFEVYAEYIKGNKVDLLLDISSNGRHSRGIIPVTLLPSIN